MHYSRSHCYLNTQSFIHSFFIHEIDMKYLPYASCGSRLQDQTRGYGACPQEHAGSSHYEQLQYFSSIGALQLQRTPRLLELSLKGCPGVCQGCAKGILSRSNSLKARRHEKIQMLDNNKQFSVADVKCMRGVMGGYIDRHLEGLCISQFLFLLRR